MLVGAVRQHTGIGWIRAQNVRNEANLHTGHDVPPVAVLARVRERIAQAVLQQVSVEEHLGHLSAWL